MSTSILGAVREEIQRTRHRLEQLERMEAMSIELAGELITDAAANARGARAGNGATRGTPSKTPAPKAPGRTPRRRLTVDEVLDGIRDALQDGPKSIQALHGDLGIGRTAHTGKVFEEALTQLGASEAGKHRGGVLYVLNGNGNGNGATATIAPPAAPAEEIDLAYLERRLTRLLGEGPKSAEEAAEAIDAPVEAVRDACDRLTRTGDLSQLADGTYVS